MTTAQIRGRCGVVLFKTNSSYSSFVTAVTKQPFSGGGFWYETSYFRTPCRVVIVMDWFGLNTPKVATGPNMTIETLQKDPGIQRLAIRSLKPIVVNGKIDEQATREREVRFRLLIAGMSVEPATPEETVADVFGMPMETSSRKTPIQMVNFIITQMLRGDLPLNENPRAECLKSIQSPLDDSEIGRLDLMTLMGTPLFRATTTPGMGSLLAEQNLLGEIQDLPLIDHSELKIRQGMLDSASKESLFMQRFSQAFVGLLFKDPLFLSTVIEGVNRGKGIEMTGRHVRQRAIHETLSSGADLVNTLNLALKRGEISSEEFSQALEKHLNQLRSLGGLFGSKQTLPHPIQMKHRALCFNASSETGVHDVLDQVVNDLRDCAQDLNSGKSPSLNLSRVTELLEKLTGEQVSIPEGRHGGFMVSNSSSTNYQPSGNSKGEDMVINANTPLKTLSRLNAADLRELDLQLASGPDAAEFVEVRERIATLLK